MRWPLFFLVLLLLKMSTASVFAQETQEIIPAEIYQAAGLAKLSESERKVLLDWLSEKNNLNSQNNFEAATSKSIISSESPSKSVARERSPVNSTILDNVLSGRDEIQARIISDFSGWDGKTIFVLDNNETWQQRMDGRYKYSGSDTRVRIRRGLFGFYRMELLATGRWIGVQRIK